MDAVSFFQVIATLFFALERFTMSILPGVIFMLPIAYAVQYNASKKSSAKLRKTLEDMLAARDEAQEAKGELAIQKETTTERHLLLAKALRYITYLTRKARYYRTRKIELERKAKQDTENHQRTLAAVTSEMKAAQDLARMFNAEVIDLRRRMAKLEVDLTDAQDALRFAEEEHEATVYMHERQILDLQDELDELKDERKRENCLDDSDEHADDEGEDSFSPNDLVCSPTALAETPDEEDPTLDEVRAYWKGVRQELQQVPDAQPIPPPPTAPLVAAPPPLVSSTSFQDRFTGRATLFMPPLSEFAGSAPLLLPGFD